MTSYIFSTLFSEKTKCTKKKEEIGLMFDQMDNGDGVLKLQEIKKFKFTKKHLGHCAIKVWKKCNKPRTKSEWHKCFGITESIEPQPTQPQATTTTITPPPPPTKHGK